MKRISYLLLPVLAVSALLISCRSSQVSADQTETGPTAPKLLSATVEVRGVPARLQLERSSYDHTSSQAEVRDTSYRNDTVSFVILSSPKWMACDTLTHHDTVSMCSDSDAYGARGGYGRTKMAFRSSIDTSAAVLRFFHADYSSYYGESSSEQGGSSSSWTGSGAMLVVTAVPFTRVADTLFVTLDGEAFRARLDSMYHSTSADYGGTIMGSGSSESISSIQTPFPASASLRIRIVLAR
ncbi:MAG: hypothetical protein JSS75_09710 [Bacteroidetes bacterium]|nr:hypothetical protein [Bacteroidota bacterium]